MKKLLLLFVCLATFQVSKAQYCSAGPSSTADSNVTAVALTGETQSINYSGCPGITGVNNQTDVYTADVVGDTSYSVDITFGTCGGSYGGAGEAWIDWNSNQTFESSESIGSWSGAPTSLQTFTFTVPLTALNGTTRLRVMQRESGSLPLDPCGSYSWGSVDDFSIDISGAFTPSCFDPSALAASGETTTTVDLTWTAGDSETLWDIELVDVTASGSATGTPTTEDVTTNPYTLSGLTAQNDYQVYLRADCGGGDTSDWIGPVSFSTPCEALTTPIAENFETFTTSTSAFTNENCWSAVGGSYFWKMAPGTDTSSGSTGPSPTVTSGNYFFTEASSGSTGDTASLSVQVDLSGLTTPYLSFDYHMYGATMGSLEVLIDTNIVLTLTGQQQTSDTSPFLNTGVVLSAYTGQSVTVTLRGTRGSSFTGDIAIDNFVINEAPACPDPTALAASGETATTVDLAWTIGDSETLWDIELVDVTASGSATGTPTTEDVTTNPYTLSGLTPENDYQVYLRADCGGGDTSDWVGPVSFTTLPTCPAPTALAASGATATTVDLAWTIGDSETLWDIELVDVTASGSATGTPTTEDVTTNPYTLSGLTSNNDYQVYLRADCSGDNSDTSTWVGPVSFTTLCAEISTFPSTTDFTLNPPTDCWSQAGNGTPAEGPTGTTSNWISGYNFSGIASNKVNLYTSSFEEWLISPTYAIPTGVAHELVLTLAVTDWNSTAADPVGMAGTDDEVQLLQTLDGGTTWTNLETWDTSNEPAYTGTDYTIDLTSLAGSSVQFALWATDGAVDDSNDYDFHVGGFTVRETPSCPTPSALTASGETATTVDLAWTIGDSETLWDIELVDVTAGGSATGTPTTEDITTNPYTLTGLTSNTNYEVYLRADCGLTGTSDWSLPISFTTLCDIISLPFAEDFENAGSTPDCWTQSGAENWLFNTSGPNHVGNGGVISGSTDSGAYYAVVDASGSEANAILTSPAVDISSLTTPMLSFYEISDNEGFANSLLTVDVYDGSAWNTVGTYSTNTANDAWEKKEIVLDGLTFTGDAQVRFTFTEPVPGDFYDDIAIDDVSFVEAPSCANVSALTTSGVTATSVDLDWTENGTATIWDIELVDVTAGGSATGTPTTNDITTNPYTLSGLTSNNDYQVYLRADCGFTGTSAWTGPVSFSTICTAVADVDENFDAALTLPDCFDSIISGGNAFFDILDATANGNNGSNFVRLRKFFSTEISTLILPPVTTLGSNYRLTFNVNNYTATPGSVFNVGTVDAEGNFTSFQEITVSTNATWESQSIDFSTYTGTDTRVAITAGYNATSNSNTQYSDLHIDDVVWEEIPACLAVSDITYTSAGTDGTSSLVSWTENGTASNYNIEVYEAGADTSTATPVYTEAVVGATNTTVTGLTAYTFYDAYVQADCGFSGASAFVMQEIYTGHCNPSSEFAVVGLDNVTTAGGDTNISNTASGFSTGGYGDFRAQAITGLVETQSFTITLDQGTLVGGKMYGWVDWNNDLAFDNTAGSSEIAFVLDNGNYSSATFTVTIPDGQAAGDYVLRVKVQQLSDGEPCGDMLYGEVEDYTISVSEACSWNGATSTDWATGSNWSTGAAPTSSDVVLVNGTFTNEPLISSSTDGVAKTVIVASGNTLTIDETSSLMVSNDFTNSGTVTLNSTADDFSSLLVEGTATGDITYNRYVNVYDDTAGGGWDLVCSPVNMTIADFITANGANIQVLGDDYAFSQYDNALGQWVRYATASQTGSFTAGQGYSMATTTGSTVAFTGTMQTTDQSINIINNNGLNGVGRRWNLVSNPFPSYIAGNAAAGTAAGTTNFMNANAAVIDSEFLAVYGWNGSSYDIYNNLSGAFSMAPGQGFWVAAANTTDTALSFTADMRTNSGTGDFVSGPQLLTYHVALKLFNGETERATTDFYFRDGLTLDLDPGYDAAAFNQSTKLSSRLAMGSQETAFGINAMDMDAMQNTRVPLEIRQNAGQTFRVSMADMDLPEDIYVYLEDTLNGTLTSLKDQDFELEAQSDLSGVDRFFIVFKSNSVLSNGDTLGLSALNVYKANNESFVTIAGITPELEKLDVTIYSILGQTVREKSLNPATATQRVSTQGLSSGLYMVQIKSGNQTTVKKVIIK